jgi:hypothetical protein
VFLQVVSSVTMSQRRFLALCCIEELDTNQARLPWLCRYDFQILSAGSAAAIFMQVIFDDLARTECRQTRSLNIRDVHKYVPFGYADFAFRHDKPITFLCIEKFHHTAHVRSASYQPIRLSPL